MKKLLVLGIMAVVVGLMFYFPHLMLNPGQLSAGHQDLESKCASCHEPFWGISSDRCMKCHKPEAIGKDSSGQAKTILFHHLLKGKECTACHTDHNGITPAASTTKFDHAILPLAERNLCNSCHVQPADTLHQHVSPSCGNCHSTSAWKSDVKFDHSLILGNLKMNCSACHSMPADEFHAALKNNCSDCHGTNKWVPSTFDHSSYFQLDKDHNVKCVTCHAGTNFKLYSCYGCHEHSESKIRSKHLEEGINNFDKCVSCHKSADEHDIRGGLEGRNDGEGKGEREGKDD